MATTNLGVVSVTMGGNFILGTAYKRLTEVYDPTSNATYRAKKDNQGVALTDATTWQKVSQGVGTGTGASDNNYDNTAKGKVDSLNGKAYSYEGKYFTINNPYKDGGSLHLKGQLHCHTTNSDGVDSPTALVTAYKNAGYDFITITDHDIILNNGATGITPDPGVSGITWIGNSIEETIFRHLVAYDIDTQSTSLNVQDTISYHRKNGKMVSIAHPNWPGAYIIPDDEIKSYYDFNFIEVYNSFVNQSSGNGEAQWDAALSFGKKVFATAVDDCHNIAASYFNGGWVVVHCNTNTKADILASLRKGNFYASTGNDITISLTDNVISASSTASSNFTFVGRDGRVLQENNAVTTATYIIKGDETYVRVKSVRTDNGKMAFSQPVFIDLIGDNTKVFADINDAASHTDMNRQAIINGNFDVWQRGTSLINPPYQSMIADEFNITDNKDTWTHPTTITHSKQDFSDFYSGLRGASSYYRITTDGDGSGTLGNDLCGIYQRIENGTRKLCGASRKVTISFWARSSIPGKRLMIGISQRYGTGGSPSASETLTGSIISLTNSWRQYIVTTDTNTLIGKTFGSNNDDYLQVRFDWIWSAANALAISGINSAQETFGGAGTFDLAQIQLCSGGQALPFVLKSYDEEFQRCNRYLRDLYGNYRMCYHDADALYFHVDTSDIKVATAIVNNGVENADWFVMTTGYGSTGTGWVLSINENCLVATKTAHGLTDGALNISSKGKVFAVSEL